VKRGNNLRRRNSLTWNDCRLLLTESQSITFSLRCGHFFPSPGNSDVDSEDTNGGGVFRKVCVCVFVFSSSRTLFFFSNAFYFSQVLRKVFRSSMGDCYFFVGGDLDRPIENCGWAKERCNDA
jgi:hypothetical protein